MARSIRVLSSELKTFNFSTNAKLASMDLFITNFSGLS